MHQQQTAFGNIAGKGEIAHNDEKLTLNRSMEIPNYTKFTELNRITPNYTELHLQIAI